MQLGIATKPAKKLFEWHRWFAWHPVLVGSVTEAVTEAGPDAPSWAWLETVERRLVRHDDYFHPDYDYFFEYRIV